MTATTWRRVGATTWRYRAELALVAAWAILLWIAQHTSRTRELFAGSLLVWAFLGALRWISGMRDAVASLERERAAEIALAVQPPRVLSEAERRQCEAIRHRIALAIRGQGAHRRED